jgi:tRNA:m4X modification enzyme
MGVWEIKRHTQNCPLKPKEFQAFQVLDINQGLPFIQPLNSRKYLLTMGIEEFSNLHKRIVFLYESVKMTFSTSIKSHPIMNERIKVSNNGKHAVQQSSLVGHLEDKGFIRPDVSFVEFGCGSGSYLLI